MTLAAHSIPQALVQHAVRRPQEVQRKLHAAIRPTGAPRQAAARRPRRSGGSRKGPGVLIGAVVALVAIIAIVAVFMLRRKPTINLSKYASLSVSGYNTVGEASYRLDQSKFREDYSGKFKIKSKNVKKALEQAAEIEGSDVDSGTLSALSSLADLDVLNNSYVQSAITDIIWSVIDYEVTPENNLSNGDKVTFHFVYDENYLPVLETLLGYKFKMDDVTLTVKDLEVVDTFDPFEGVEVTFKGTAPSGRMDNVTRPDNSLCDGIEYRCGSNDGSLSNGDTFTLSIYSNLTNEQYLEYYNKIPSPSSKDYTVSGLAYYPTSISEIPEDYLSEIISMSETTIHNEVDQNWEDDEQLQQADYLGLYYVTGTTWYGDYSDKIYAIYKIKETIGSETIDYYWYYKLENIYVNADGTWEQDWRMYSSSCTDNYTIDAAGRRIYGGHATAEDLYNAIYNWKDTNNKFELETNITDADLQAAAAAAAAAE